jgi:hypothetical protein
MMARVLKPIAFETFDRAKLLHLSPAKSQRFKKAAATRG